MSSPFTIRNFFCHNGLKHGVDSTAGDSNCSDTRTYNRKMNDMNCPTTSMNLVCSVEPSQKIDNAIDGMRHRFDIENSSCFKKRHVAAFFDFDKTIVSVDSQEMEAISLLKNPKSWPTIHYPLRLLNAAMHGVLVKYNLMDPEKCNDCCFGTYQGFPLKYLVAHAESFYRRTLQPKLYPEILELVEKHKKQGHLVFLLSGSTETLLNEFVKDVHFDAWKGSVLETNSQGVCTGKSDGPIMLGVEKVKEVRKLAKDYFVDLESSFAYSDHHGDISFLAAVGKPTAVNPTPNLAKVAKHRKWPVLIVTSSHSEPPASYSKEENNPRTMKNILIVILNHLRPRFVIAMICLLVMNSISNTGLDGSKTIPPILLKSNKTKISNLCIITMEAVTHEETVSGSALLYRDLVDYFVKNNVSVLVVEPDRQDGRAIIPHHRFANVTSEQLKTHRIASKSMAAGLSSFGIWGIDRSTRQSIISFHPDLIIVPDPGLIAFDTLMLPGYYESKELGIPLVYDIHTNYIECAPLLVWWGKLPGAVATLHTIHKWVLGVADLVTVTSIASKENLQEHTGFHGKIAVTHRWTPRRQEEQTLSKKTSSSPSVSLMEATVASNCDVTFSWVGRLSPEKHISEVLHSMDLLLKGVHQGTSNSGRRPCLLIAGPDQGKLKEVWHYTHKHPKSIFYVGSLNLSDVDHFIELSDALVFIGSVVDTFATVISEARENQRPVISVTTPESVWWRNRSLPHVDLTISEDLAGGMVGRMRAFVNNQDGLQTHLVDVASSTATVEGEEGMLSFDNAIRKFENELQKVVALGGAS